MNPYPRTHTCTDCETTFTGSHAVRDGERYCQDCVPIQASTVDTDPPETVAAFNRSRRMVDVSELMDGGDPR